MVKAAEAAIEVLRAEGVRYLFGIPGFHTIHFYDALHHSPGLTHILVRHEQAAANMAAAYAQLTGQPGVCIATAGPGATNLVSGIAEAYVGALPVVIIAGRADTRAADRGAGQDIAQDRVFEPITKWAVKVHRADVLVDTLRRAFAVARSGRPGPVLVDVPVDLEDEVVEFAGYRPLETPVPVRAPASLVAEVAARLARSTDPIIIAGGGASASDCRDALVRFAERERIPVLTTLSGRGSFPDDHPLAAGGLGFHSNSVSRDLLRRADLILGLGSHFAEMETNWEPGMLPAPNACYVQVDTDPIGFDKGVAPTLPVVSDARLFLEDLFAHLTGRPQTEDREAMPASPRISELLQGKQQLEVRAAAEAASARVPLNPVRIFSEAREVFGRDATAAVDIGVTSQGLGGAYPFFKVHQPRSLIVPTGFYGMGFASSGLPVAKLVYPDRPALGFCGDGSFQMVMHVLPVAAEFELGVTWCVLTNHSLNSISVVQDRLCGGRRIATSFRVTPDFAAIARACGCHGERVEKPEDIKPALGRCLELNEQGIPALLDFQISDEPPEVTREF
jgi:acetolactate synthase I/II/III large subunit